MVDVEALAAEQQALEKLMKEHGVTDPTDMEQTATFFTVTLKTLPEAIQARFHKFMEDSLTYMQALAEEQERIREFIVTEGVDTESFVKTFTELQDVMRDHGVDTSDLTQVNTFLTTTLKTLSPDIQERFDKFLSQDDNEVLQAYHNYFKEGVN